MALKMAEQKGRKKVDWLVNVLERMKEIELESH